MTWTKFHDGAPNHPKVLRAGAEAAWLWAACLMHSNAHQLDGRLAKDLVPYVYPPLARKSRALAARLVLVGLWHDRGDHYEIHDYEQYQEQALKLTVETRRETDRERKREQRQRPKALPGGVRPAPLHVEVTSDVPLESERTNGGVQSATRARPGPARPDPTEINPPPSPSLLRVTGESALMEQAAEDHFARQLSTRFAALFERRFKDYPSLGGKNVGTFARRLARTAQLRNVDPLELVDLAFDRWTQKPLDSIAKRAPYACFIAHFGELIDSPAATANEQTHLLEQQDEALRKGDRALYAKLVEEYRSQFGGEDGPQPSV